MSTAGINHPDHSSSFVSLRDGAFRCRTSMVRAMIGAVRSWRSRLSARRELRHLYALDDRLLRDIGLTRDDVFHELSKSIWWRPTLTHRSIEDFNKGRIRQRG
jgi:uncharacterized protein YjiS (DUF1127 family)